MLLLVLDIETTGLSRTEHNITVIGTIVYESSNETVIREKCYNVAIAEAHDCKQDLIAMKKEISELLDDADSIVAFNGINFDMPFIRKWLRTSVQNEHLPQLCKSVDSDINTDASDNSLGKRKVPECMENAVVATSCDVDKVADENDAINVSVQDPWKHKYLDFCRLSRDYTGSYISLHNVCLLNEIDVAKSGSGAQAVQWASDKNWVALESYCMQDVVVLLALTKHALRSGITFRLRTSGKRKTHHENVIVSFDALIQPFVAATPADGAGARDIFDTASPNALKHDD